MSATFCSGRYDLPPLMFSADEIDAIAVGARHVRRLRDPKIGGCNAANIRDAISR